MLSEKVILTVFPKAPAKELLDGFKRFNILDDKTQIDLLAQMACESVKFTVFTENLNYSATGLRRVFPKYFPTDESAKAVERQPEKIANIVYANRMGNGDSDSGEGWKYRGRGCIQLTGKSNYITTGRTLKSYWIVTDENEIVNNPDVVAKLPLSILTAFCFIVQNKLHTVTDFKSLTRKINGGLNGYEERLGFRNKLLEVYNKELEENKSSEDNDSLEENNISIKETVEENISNEDTSKENNFEDNSSNEKEDSNSCNKEESLFEILWNLFFKK